MDEEFFTTSYNDRNPRKRIRYQVISRETFMRLFKECQEKNQSWRDLADITGLTTTSIKTRYQNILKRGTKLAPLKDDRVVNVKQLNALIAKTRKENS